MWQSISNAALSDIDLVLLVIQSSPIRFTSKALQPFSQCPTLIPLETGELHPSLPGKSAPPPAIGLTHQPLLGVCLINPMICCHPSDLVSQNWSCSKHTHDIVLLSTGHLSALTVTLYSLVAFHCSYYLFPYNQAPWSFKSILCVCMCVFIYTVWQLVYLPVFSVHILVKQCRSLCILRWVCQCQSQSVKLATTKRHGFVKKTK